jgi:hypothetical protein
MPDKKEDGTNHAFECMICTNKTLKLSQIKAFFKSLLNFLENVLFLNDVFYGISGSK